MRAFQILEKSAASWPDNPALIDEQGSLSYLALYQQTRQLTVALKKAGLGEGQGLGVMGRNGRDFIMAMFAGMACGATVLPLSHQLKQVELNTIIAETGLHAVIDDGSGLEPLTKNATTRTLADTALRFNWTATPAEIPIVSALDAAFIRYTSGTTGTSKGVVLTHERILERIETAQQAFNLTADDKVLWVLPMAFHFVVTIMLYLRCGAAIIICRDLLAKNMISAANQYHATLLYAAPMHYRLLAADQSEIQMPSLRRAVSTSSAIAPEVATGFTQRFKIPVVQAYGIIEAGIPMLDNDPENFSSDTVGFPAPEFQVGILNQDFRPVAEGETGHLAIRGPGMFNAYLSPWRTCEEVMVNGWFLTGDLAFQRNDARVVVCGREKAMINVSGNKAFPEEIEAVLNNYPDIIDSLVFSQPHPLLGEIVSARIILKPDRKLKVEDILFFCRQRLSTYKVPQRLEQVEHIPHTDSGKIIRARQLIDKV